MLGGVSREQINFNSFSLKSAQHFQLVQSKLRDFHNHWKMNALVCDSALDGCQKALVGLVFSPLFLIRFPDKHQRPIIIALSRDFFIRNQFLFERKSCLFTNRARDQGMLVELILLNFQLQNKTIGHHYFQAHISNANFDMKIFFHSIQIKSHQALQPSDTSAFVGKNSLIWLLGFCLLSSFE